MPQRRDELLVHVLAQLPEDWRLELTCPAQTHAQLRLEAEAYGVGPRLALEPSGNGSSGGSYVSAGGEVDAFDPGLGSPTLARLVHHVAPGHPPNAEVTGADDVFDGQRIALVTNLPAPYRIPLFRAMAERLTTAGAEFSVFFGAVGETARPWVGIPDDAGFDYRVGRGTELRIRSRRPPILGADLPGMLRAFRPTLILSGGMTPLMTGPAAWYAARHGIPLGVWSGEIPASAPASRARKLVRRLIMRRAAFAVAYGSLAAEYLRTLYPGPIVIGRNSSPVPASTGGARSAGHPVRIATVADLSGWGKGVDLLVDAVRARPDLDCEVTVAGGGALLEAMRDRIGGDARIRLVGSLAHQDVQEVLRSSDVFLFPTKVDRFGLALLEGMGAGLASASSAAPGLLADLGIDGVNCLVVADRSVQAWSEAVARLVADAPLREGLGESARRTVRSRWTIEHAANAMVAGLRLGLLRS